MPLYPQVSPFRIIGFDQGKLPFPAPFLDQLFTGNGSLDLIVTFGVDQSLLLEVGHVD